MAKALGYRFTDEELRRGVYYPKAHSEREAAQLANLQNIKRLLAGETAINMNVKEFPASPEAIAAQTALAQRVAGAYAEDGSLRITVVNDPAGKSRDA
jgi:CO/xanthine dehydrogenase FAD-binding subunit